MPDMMRAVLGGQRITRHPRSPCQHGVSIHPVATLPRWVNPRHGSPSGLRAATSEILSPSAPLSGLHTDRSPRPGVQPRTHQARHPSAVSRFESYCAECALCTSQDPDQCAKGGDRSPVDTQATTSHRFWSIRSPHGPVTAVGEGCPRTARPPRCMPNRADNPRGR